jgi:hypothetical protein
MLPRDYVSLLPSQFKRLTEALRSSVEPLLVHLSDAEDALKRQEHSIRETAQASDEKRDEIRRVVARVATALESSNTDVPAYEKTQRKKEYGLQRWSLLPAWITAVATTAAFIAASIYACIANRQLSKMDATYQEMRKQTYMGCLNAQAAQKSTILSLAATQASIAQTRGEIEAQRSLISFSARTPNSNEMFYQKLGLPISFKNEGKSMATDLSLRYKAVLLQNTETLRINDKGFHTMRVQNFPAGAEYPGRVPNSQQPPITEENQDRRN